MVNHAAVFRLVGAGVLMCCSAAAMPGVVRVHPLATPDAYTIPLTVSDGGQVIAGYAQTSPQPMRGVMWGPERVPSTLAQGPLIPQAMTADGRCIVGRVGNSGAWRWTAEDGIVVLAVQGDANWTNGQTTLGFAKNPLGANFFGARWNVGQAGITWYYPAAGDFSSRVMGATDDLSVLVGATFTNDGIQRAARWTAPGEAATVLEARPFSIYGFAEGVSANGSVIIGSSGSSGADRYPVRWNAAGQMSQLPTPGEFPFGTAIAVSRDGRVIAGLCWSDPNEDDHSALWINGQFVLVGDLLVSHGVQPALAHALKVTSVSRDGRFVTAFKHYTQGIPYLIELPPTCGTADFNGDGNFGTDQDIEAFFACLTGSCCETCDNADFNGDGDFGTDQDIEAFFRVLAGGSC
jgi:uncharacterized membrane protein